MFAKSIALGTVAVFVLWSILDFIIHGVLLTGLYASTPTLFRPMEQMNMGMLYGVTILVALCFTLLFGLNAPRASMGDAGKFGLLYGLAGGLGMGFGTYVVQPIPLMMGVGWFLGTVVEATLAALVLQWVYQRK